MTLLALDTVGQPGRRGPSGISHPKTKGVQPPKLKDIEGLVLQRRSTPKVEGY